ncbi:hypothetical protein SLEP1_g40138 [Rubroshorea leprosula]|uniref:Uncharacterized protein n=1 Tax=Rubroshorea leprosula TaxID=152421 RepID=A0AAV5L2I3_9ROSI|nr:hypothetical protein SLEP1_g40138 [Rubroshorea leprosula]
MEYQNYLRKVGHEGFEIIDVYPGYPRPQSHTELQEPFGNFTTYVYQVQPKVPTRKAAVPPSKDVAFSGNGRPNADQVPQSAKPKEPVTWYICKVPQVPKGNGGILTSDQAGETYGGFVSKKYCW